MAKSVRPVTEFSNEDLAKVYFKEISLTVIISDDGLSFLAVRDASPIAFEKYNSGLNNFDEIIVSSKFYNKTFKNVNLVFDLKYFTIVPSFLNDENEKEKISQAFFGKNDFNAFISKDENIDFIYAVDNQSIEPFQKVWPEARLFHYSEIFYKNISKQSKADEEVYIDIRSDYFLAAIFKNTNLLLLNKYDFSSKYDFGFFSLGIINQHSLDNKKLNLYLSGNIAENSTLQMLLENYISNIMLLTFANIPKEFRSFQHIIKFFNG